MHVVTLPEIGTFDAWRDTARGLLCAGVPPEDIAWHRGTTEADLFGGSGGPLPRGDGEVTVPKGFVSLVRDVVWHRDPERFARAYTLLWRLQRNRRLLDDRGDPLVDRLQSMAKEVRRDKHKMTAFVRFRDIGQPDAARRSFAAWFEPSHFTLEPTTPFFAKRFGDMDWIIQTPDLTATFEDGKVRFSDGVAKPPVPEDATEELWRTYFRSIFNPARLKVKAMQAEMPKKYWKNMPEAALIPELIAGAQARAAEMAAAAPTLAPARAGRITERFDMDHAERPPVDDRDSYLRELAGCRRCPLWENATQAVPGEGPLDAELMIVGEQPGDQEDLAGRPFVGPAGQLFDEAAEQAGLDRRRAFITNAVKHFKFTPRGKRRIHQSPNSSEISHCRWWLDAERTLVQPKLILGMGGTALESLTGDRKGILKRRGQVEHLSDGTPMFVTVHPSYILRLPDRGLRDEETARFREDLRGALDWLRAA
ncbi:UdgX family uracil-DNA binding protein [Pelagovum pacificum]|uniref:Type-4 uracil-DNA glycosylase n=1 Tax=Pelagovum pacificum TaxID=2588711 RepID=A0A5C5GBH6_9RHOB|nr:UdgX family uracil-DNA binding protein [Pelagovum pacificum]QQA44740.1 UdgX family uracil-DNA binding protein [Pelagovum pacificum]TNY32152.1 UdgX family uracil-DNA binding protein [Pelagovum pacificum]